MDRLKEDIIWSKLKQFEKCGFNCKLFRGSFVSKNPGKRDICVSLKTSPIYCFCWQASFVLYYYCWDSSPLFFFGRTFPSQLNGQQQLECCKKKETRTCCAHDPTLTVWLRHLSRFFAHWYSRDRHPRSTAGWETQEEQRQQDRRPHFSVSKLTSIFFKAGRNFQRS